MSIEAIASAIPSVHQSAEQIAEQCSADVDFIKNKVGVSGRYILGPEETGISLAAQACEKLLDRQKLNISDIGLIVFVTQNPDRKLPQNSAGLAAALSAPMSCASFDVSLGCSGFVYGLAITEAFLQSHAIDNALLVTCDPYSRIMAAEDKATNAVFGDAATATLVARNGTKTQLKGLEFGTDGGKGDAISVAAGGVSRPFVALSVDAELDVGTRDDHRLFMDGRSVFNFVNETIPRSIQNSLAKAKLEIDDIDFYALHQGSLFMLDALARRARLPSEKVLKNIENYGNTVSSTIPMLLEAIMDSGKLDRGGKVLISGFGVGLSWATAVLEYKEQIDGKS